MAKETGFLIEGETTTDVLHGVWQNIEQYGTTYQGQRGEVRSIKGVEMVIHQPLAEAANYPYWDKESDDWYQNNFVRKESTQPPETIKRGDDIYPYKYSWRSRFHDGGLGYVKGVRDLLYNTGSLPDLLADRTYLIRLLKNTYQVYHPEIVLSVLAWKGIDLLDFYINNPKVLEQELTRSRRDTLQSVIDKLKDGSLESRRAITPSFIYEPIDHNGMAGGVPVYQNYQLYVNFEKDGTPKSLTSMHLHRAMDAKGGTQLDITHDREWGLEASRQIGLPLDKIVIYCNDIWLQESQGVNQDLEERTDIRSWLFAVTDGYDPKTEDIEKRLAKPIYQKKLAHTLAALRNSR